jgi:1,4-dihydroxy-6-naphthoate synthase
MTRETLRVGISTCPNDTFAFHGLLSGTSDPQGFDWQIELCDVQTLNERWLAGDFDVAKASFAAALQADEDTLVLPVGSAIGRGVGPVVLARPDAALPSSPLVLAPGEHTTATLLWRLLQPGRGRLAQVVFSAIMPALARGEADLGVCIHEGRFTYREHGLRLELDLGALWERESLCPLPLGGILARRRLGPQRCERAARAIAASLACAGEDSAATTATLRRYAQEHSDEVLWKHVELYVTDDTRGIGAEGRNALRELARRARAAGLARSARPLALSDEPASWA